MIRIMIVDDHEFVRIGLRHILEEYADFEVVAEATNGEMALRLNHECRPDVILLAVELPGLSGFEITRRLSRSGPQQFIIALSIHNQSPFPEKMLDAGASGYLTKGCPAVELVQAIRRVVSGERYISADIAQQLALRLTSGTGNSPFDELSAREMEVLLMVTDGRRIADIADVMHLSPKTVATYKYRIYDKLETRNDVDVTRMAMRYGLVATA
ncbi:MAG TPA: response regulator [Xanthomonadales bacterium]|nr:response regulator [Xanthomonadales bacterium]